ncbi:T9SS type A sorting domain-containing protein [bacterium]|nr:T9SS type A sorting domain-containing protein [bacterium]
MRIGSWAAVAVASAMACTVAAHADGIAARDPAPHASIHAWELADWHAREADGWTPWVDPAAKAPAPIVPRGDTLDHLVYGFHPYWMNDAYTAYEWSLLSAVAWFSLELDGGGQVAHAHGWPWNALVTEAHAHGVPVLVTVTLFDAAALDALLVSPAHREAAVANVVAQVVAGGADGVCVDFEGVPHARKADLVTFLGELQAALGDAVASPLLTIATPAVDWGDAFDYDELAARCDQLVVMAYDYHWSGSGSTGPIAPLGGWGTYNVPWTVNDYVFYGAPRSKMLLGVPYYGYEWGTVSGAAGAATTGSGLARTYAQAAGDAALFGSMWDAPSSTPWMGYQDPTWFQTWYDDEASLAAKYAYAEAEGLAGVSIWALGYDGARPELWSALAGAFGIGSGVPVVAAARVTLAHAGVNPFRNAALVRWALPRDGSARVTVHDVQGRRVRTLREGNAAASGELRWDGRDAGGAPVPSGVYFVRLEAEEDVTTLQVVRRR